MKKILCLIDTLGMGGAERQIIGLALLLKQRGYRTDLICYDDHDFFDELVDGYGLGSLMLHVGNSPLSKLMAVRRHIKQSGGYDVVISYKNGPNIIGCLLKLMGMKFCLLVSERNTTQHLRRKEKLKFYLYRWADFVVPNSYSQSAFIKEFFPWLKKTVVVTNFTDIDHFVPTLLPEKEKLTILTTARIAAQKNVLKYLDTVALLKKRGIEKIHFDWYGDVQTGEEAYGEKVFDKVKSLKLEDIITFHPATPQILEQYQNCDIFCLPSNYEGYPNVVCEAMSCGKPVVCSRVCDNPNIVKEEENALMFDQTSAEDMADKLQRMCTMRQEERNEWGHRSRKIAEKTLSMESFVNKYIELIES